MYFRSIMISVLAGALIACGGPEERKAKYRDKAQEYLSAGNFPKARVALRNVLKIDPKDADAYYLFAQVEEKEKNWRNAVGLYQEVIQLAPDHTGALITLAKYYLEARLTDHVLSTADKVLATNPRQPQALALKIAAFTTDNNTANAITQAESLAAEFPTEPDVAILLATLYSQDQRYRDAETTIRRALNAHPQDMDLLNNLSLVMSQAKDLPGTEAIARRMIEIEPTVFDHRLKLARLFDEHGAPERAESVLREAIALDAQSEERYLILADFLATRKNVPAAEHTLLDAAKTLPRSTKIQFALAALYRQSGQAAKAHERYDALVQEFKDKPAGLEAKVKLAEMDLVAGKDIEAARQLQDVLKENPRSPEALVLSGRMAMARRNGKEAVQAFRTVVRDQPELATAHFLLGQAYQLTGELNLAKESFERAVALYPGQVDARRSLAAIENQSGRPQQARTRLTELLKQQPGDLAALDMLMMLDLTTNNWAEAERTLDRLHTASNHQAVAFIAEGRLRQAQGRFDQATAAYERATMLAPNDPDPLLSLVKLDIAQNHADRAKARLDLLLAARPDHQYGHGLLGEVLTLTGHAQEADLQFREATRINPHWLAAWLNWGSLWLNVKEADRSVPIIQAGLQAIPGSEELYMLLASAYSAQNQIDHAITAYDETLRVNPRNLLAANNLAVLLADYKSDQPSLQKAFALSRDFEKDAPHPLFLDTLGWVKLKMGQHEEALRIMKDAVAKSPEMPTLNYHLGMAHFQAGHLVESRVYLSKALKSTDPFQGRQEAAQILAQMKG